MDRRAEELICRVADGCASPDEERELELMAEREPEIGRDLMAQQEAVSSIRSMGLRELDDEEK